MRNVKLINRLPYQQLMIYRKLLKIYLMRRSLLKHPLLLSLVYLHLAVVLFFILINDVENVIKHSKILLYLDDLKIFEEIVNNIDLLHLKMIY